jgi:hypothetical protein
VRDFCALLPDLDVSKSVFGSRAWLYASARRPGVLTHGEYIVRTYRGELGLAPPRVETDAVSRRGANQEDQDSQLNSLTGLHLKDTSLLTYSTSY